MQPFDSLAELIAFLLSASGSLSVEWRGERLTLREDERGFHGTISRRAAAEMRKLGGTTMPRETLQDLALAVLRYDQAIRRIAKDNEAGCVSCIADPDELYDNMLELAREALQANLLPRP